MHQPTERVLKVIGFFAEHKESASLATLSRELNIPKSTLLPILNSMCDLGFLSKSEGGYIPGISLYALSSSFSENVPVFNFIRRELFALVSKLCETCYFGVLDGGDVLYLDKVDSPEPLRMLTTVGHRLPAYSTGIGKALLLNKSRSEIEELYGNRLLPVTDKTVKSIDDLIFQLNEAKILGYTSECEESTAYIRCFGVPIYKKGKIVAGISVAIPLFRYDEKKLNDIVFILKSFAKRIERIIESDGDKFFK